MTEETRLYYRKGHVCKHRPREHPKAEVNPICKHFGKSTVAFY
jgi:hypothetical protein